MSSADHIADFFQSLDLRLLNDKERQELLDFYNSLLRQHNNRSKLTKQTKSKKTKQDLGLTLFSFLVKPFEPLKREKVYARF